MCLWEAAVRGAGGTGLVAAFGEAAMAYKVSRCVRPGHTDRGPAAARPGHRFGGGRWRKVDLVRRKEGKGVREPMAATTLLPEAEMGAPMH